MSLSTPQYVLPGYLCRSAVRVPMELMLSGFSRQHDYLLSHPSPKGPAYCRRSAQGTDLPAPLNAYSLQRAFRQRAAVSLLRHRNRSQWKSRNIKRVSHRPRRSA